MKHAEKLLESWRNYVPGNGVPESDVVMVLEHLGMAYKRNGLGHIQASHRDLNQSEPFPFGSFTINCHAYGKQGMAHPAAIRDLLRAADIIAALREQGDEN